MPASIPRFLAHTADRLPEKTAIVSRERSITFAQLQFIFFAYSARHKIY